MLNWQFFLTKNFFNIIASEDDDDNDVHDKVVQQPTDNTTSNGESAQSQSELSLLCVVCDEKVSTNQNKGITAPGYHWLFWIFIFFFAFCFFFLKNSYFFFISIFLILIDFVFYYSRFRHLKRHFIQAKDMKHREIVKNHSWQQPASQHFNKVCFFAKLKSILNKEFQVPFTASELKSDLVQLMLFSSILYLLFVYLHYLFLLLSKNYYFFSLMSCIPPSNETDLPDSWLESGSFRVFCAKYFPKLNKDRPSRKLPAVLRSRWKNLLIEDIKKQLNEV